MSGHSHYATIHRQKEAKDAKKGKIFSKLSKAISLAVKSGGSDDPEMNYKLRMAVEQARASNMPKDSIENAIKKASTAGDLQEVVYEGFGPYGIAVLIETATDNKNRTVQELKNIFERGGGSLGSPGSTAFNFRKSGLILVEKKPDVQSQILSLIDFGVEDVSESGDALEVFARAQDTGKLQKELEDSGEKVISVELIMKPSTPEFISDKDKADKIVSFLDKLDDHDDVQSVYANVEIDDNLLISERS